jgi:hypothetical protein
MSATAFDDEYVALVARRVTDFPTGVEIDVEANGADPTAKGFRIGLVQLTLLSANGSQTKWIRINVTNDFDDPSGMRQLTGVEFRKVILAVAATKKQLWAKDAKFVMAAILRETGVRLRSLRSIETSRAFLAPDSAEAPSIQKLEYLARKSPHLATLAEEEQRQQSLWNARSITGHRVDRYALSDAELHLKQARAAMLDATKGVDLWDSAHPAPIFDWLDRRGIQITDENGKRRLSNEYWDEAIVPDGQQRAFEFFTGTRKDAAGLAKVKEIRTHLDRNSRVHTHFNTMGAATGRFTSTQPAIQNIPKTLRHLLIADPGEVLVSSDLNFCEIATMAMLSGDPQLVEACQGDPYEAFAIAVHGEIARGDKTLRARYKVALISALYGRGPRSLARLLKVSVSEAGEILQLVRSTYPTLATWLDTTIATAKSGGDLLTLHGRRLPKPAFAYQAPNHVTQASAAELWKKMVLAVADATGDASLWAPMHDELVVSVKNRGGVLENTNMALLRCMTATVNGVTISGTPVLHGDSWGGHS